MEKNHQLPPQNNPRNTSKLKRFRIGRMPAFPMLLMLLEACGGSQGNTDNPRPVETDLFDKWKNVSVTDPSTLPSSGSATYNGIVEIESSELDATGDLKMVVSFSDDSLSGKATKFVDDAGTRMGGSLDFTEGNLCRCADPFEDFTFNGKVGGRLTRGDREYDFDGAFAGDFLGKEHNAMRGRIGGRMGVGLLFGDFDGRFVGER